MKKIILLSTVSILFFVTGFAQNVGIGTSTPNASAQLDIQSSTKGILIPRVTTAQMSAIVSPAKGLMVLDTLTNQLMVNMGTAILPNWQSVVTGTGWALKGNSGTDPTLDFVGTLDTKPLIFGVNNILSGRIDTNWNVALGMGAFNYVTSGTGNSALGQTALWKNTSGNYNTAIGRGALSFNIGGDNNTSVGKLSLYNNRRGNDNVAMGNGALFNDTLPNNIVAIGDSALFSQNYSPGFPGNNTAVGSKVLFNTADGYANTAVGNKALFTNTSGSGNTAYGDNSLYNNTIAWNNAAYGNYSLNNNTTGQGNVAIGSGAMQDNKTGSYNTAVGLNALRANNAANGGVFNIAVGAHALYYDTIGSQNVSVGVESLLSNTTGSNNVALGNVALKYHRYGDRNTAIGHAALVFDTTSSDNTAVGFNSLYGQLGNTGGAVCRNTAVGAYSMTNNNSGTSNTSVGLNSLLNNNSGSANTAVGENALSVNTSGTNNTALGTSADVLNNNQTNSSAIGGLARVDCSNCMVLGSVNGINGALSDVNVGIGATNPVHARLEINGSLGDAVAIFGANKYGTTIKADYPGIGFNFFYNGGSKTIKAGYAALMEMSPSTGDIYVGGFNGNLSATDFGDISGYSQILTMKQNGNVGIGVTNPAAILDVQKNGGTTTLVNFKGTTHFSHFMYGVNEDTYIRGGLNSSNIIIGDLNNGVIIGGGGILPGDKLTITGGNLRVGGSIVATSNICAFGTIGACSDIRYKTNFSGLKNSLQKIQRLHAIYYNWKQDEFPQMHFSNERQLGLSAQEVEKYFPEIVQTNDDGYKAVDYSRLTPVLIEGIKEQQQQIEELRKENAGLKSRIERLEKILAKN